MKRARMREKADEGERTIDKGHLHRDLAEEDVALSVGKGEIKREGVVRL